MKNQIEISEAAMIAASAEVSHLEPLGHHVQQLLNDETEKLRKENKELKMQNSSPFLTLPVLMETLKNLEALATEWVYEYKIDDNPNDFPAICKARKWLGVKGYENE